jgi:HEAT repeats
LLQCHKSAATGLVFPSRNFICGTALKVDNLVMGNWRRHVFLPGFAAIAGVVLLAWLLFPERAPRYEGKTLQDWLGQFQTNRWPTDTEAKAAIQHFGTTGAAVCLRMVGTHESSVKLKLLRLVPAKLQTSLPVETPAEYARAISDRRRLGANGFMALGEEARPAVPGLISLLNDTNHEVRYLSIFALRCLGPVAREALPELTNCLADRDFDVRDDAVMAMGTMHADPEHVVPLVMAFLEKYRSDAILCSDSLGALGQFGTNAASAVPLIESFLNDKTPQIAADAANALKRIDPEAAAKAGVK